ncbi:flagellar protein FliT [Heyndrickxia ginsengihumi]|uniref:flagellar protein FliT n=1 Tax=Heyndrickxia ginsengihumi TaxID=363870 RepID=UPI0004B7FE67|nr:flagellar protein FliT [Heyndrickxia ginsengihumi]
MNHLENYLQLTEELLALFDQKLERVELISHVKELLAKRERHLAHIQPPFTDDDQMVGKKIVDLDQTLKPLLQQVKIEIQQDMKTVVKKRTNMKQYINPYTSLQLHDGRFYDRRR